jgi:hypothetical protein
VSEFKGRIHLQSCVKMVGLMATRVVCGTVQVFFLINSPIYLLYIPLLDSFLCSPNSQKEIHTSTNSTTIASLGILSSTRNRVADQANCKFGVICKLLPGGWTLFLMNLCKWMIFPCLRHHRHRTVSF